MSASADAALITFGSLALALFAVCALYCACYLPAERRWRPLPRGEADPYVFSPERLRQREELRARYRI